MILFQKSILFFGIHSNNYICKYFLKYKGELVKNQFSHTRELFSEIDFDDKLLWIIWPRWVWKTTLLLKYLSQNDLSKSLYISADNIYFLENKLFDFAFRFRKEYDWRLFIIDEIHKYKNWQQELKNIYDSIPNLQIVFSWSSSIDLKWWNYDLSRRAKLYTLNWFSFREYVNYIHNIELPKYDLETIISNHLLISQEIHDFPIIQTFKKYIEGGYYPYYVNEKQKDASKIIETIEKIIYDDIAQFYNIKTENLIYFKKILNYLSAIDPWEINVNKISKTLQIDNKTVNSYLEILEKWWLVRFFLQDIFGYNIMKNTSKIYLENTNLLFVINKMLLQEVKIWSVRETFFIQAIQNSKNKIKSTKILDFVIWEKIFEIWWRNKTFKQIKDNKENSFLVLDDILVWEKNVIPLWIFGLL